MYFQSTLHIIFTPNAIINQVAFIYQKFELSKFNSIWKKSKIILIYF